VDGWILAQLGRQSPSFEDQGADYGDSFSEYDPGREDDSPEIRKPALPRPAFPAFQNGFPFLALLLSHKLDYHIGVKAKSFNPTMSIVQIFQQNISLSPI
jgi:hypothetical protein